MRSNPASPFSIDRVVRGGIGVFVFAIVLAVSAQTRDATEPVKLLVLQTGTLLLAIVLCAGFLNERRRFADPGPLFFVFAAYVALNVVSAALSDYPRYSLDDARRLVALLVLFFIGTQVYREAAHLRSLLACVCVAVACSSVYALFQKVGVDPFPWADRSGDLYRQLPGTLGNPNVAGHAMVMALIAAVALAFESRLRWVAVVLPVIALHMYFTGHRSGWLALFAAAGVAGAVIFARRAPRPASQTKAWGLVAALVSGGVALLVLITVIAAANAARAVPSDISTVVRVNGYYNTARMIQDSPLLGYGPGAYFIESPRYWTDFEQDWFESTRMMNRHVHNEYLESAVAAGLPGAGLYAAFLITALWLSASLAFGGTSSSDRRTGILFTALFTGFAIDSAFGFNFNSPASGALAALAGSALSGTYRGARKPNIPVPLIGILVIVVCATMTVAQFRRYRGEMHYHAGLAQLHAGHHTQAEQRLARAEALTPWDWHFARERGVVQYELGAYGAAMPHLQRSLERNPNWIPTLIPLANAALNQATAPGAMTNSERERLLDEAVRYAAAVLALNPYSALGAEALGRARYTQAAFATQLQGEAAAQRDWRTARDALERAVANGPEAPGVLLAMLGQAQSTLGQPDEAVRSLTAAVRAEPHQDTHWTTLYNVAQKYQRFDTLEELAAEALTNGGDRAARARVLLWRAIARELGEREPDTVIEGYREALQANPSDPEVWGQFGFFVARKGGIEAYREAFQALPRPSIPGLRALEAVWSGVAPRYDDALAILESAVSEKDEPLQAAETKSIRWAAMILAHDLGEPSNPADAAALVGIGRFLVRAEEFEAARLAFTNAAETLGDADRPAAWAQAAETSLRMEDVGAARHYVELAMAIDANDPAVQLALARVLHAEGRTAEALERASELLRSPRLSAELRAEVEAFLAAIDSAP